MSEGLVTTVQATSDDDGALHRRCKARIAELALQGAPLDVVYRRAPRDEFDEFHREAIAFVDQSERKRFHERESVDYAAWYARMMRQVTRACHQTAVAVEDASIEAGEFFGRYFALNRPVVLRRIFDAWPQIEPWTFEFLERSCPDIDVEVMLGDHFDRHSNPDAYRTMMPFRTFLSRVQVEEGNHLYLVAQNSIVLKGHLQEMIERLPPKPGLLKEGTYPPVLWIGPKGSVTHLHYDQRNILHVQMSGRKHFLLFAPWDTSLLYKTAGSYSEVDVSDPDTKRHPLFKYAQRLSVEIGPGDALFLPVGWWHYVEGLSPTIAVAFRNFARVNRYV